MGRKSVSKAPADTATNATAPRKRDRGPARNYEHADAVLSTCPKCKSTDRGPYFRKREFGQATTPTGEPCTHVVLRYTTCANPDCGQNRIDRSYENRI